METREELSTTCNPIVMSRCLSAPDATSLHLHSLAQPDPLLNRYAEIGLAERNYTGVFPG